MFGLDASEPAAIRGGGPVENARIALAILKGQPSPRSDVVALNAGAGLYVSGAASSIHEGVEMARKSLSSGRAMQKVRQFAMLSWELEKERQSGESPETLVSRPLHPDVLLSRAAGLSGSLAAEAEKSSEGRNMLGSLDPLLLERPNVLSVIFLRRIKALSENRTDCSAPAGHLRRKLSESVKASKGLAVIAEYKSRSPTSEPLSIPQDPAVVADAYAAGGVAGVSVVVEPDFFSGSPQLFSEIRSRVELPMLFKDFVVSADQIDLADRLGADAVLLIAKALRPEALESLARRCITLGIEPVVEVHDEPDIRKLRGLPIYDEIPLVGVNSRDLTTLRTDITCLKGLREKITSEKLVIAESGVSKADDLGRMLGYDAALVGTAFMRADDLGSMVRELVAAGRSVAR
jgi:indole-3-glycerol phosphate synthase